MDQERPPIERPWWVKVSLWGLSTRRSVWAFVWLSMAIGLGCVFYGFGKPLWSLAAIGFFLAGTLYLLAIRWVDQHGAWS